MTQEIERRFLLRSIPALAYPLIWTTLRQGYLAVDDINEVRLREQQGAYTLTVKNGSGLTRHEVDTALSAEEFARLWPLTSGRQLEKRRAMLPWQNSTLFIDDYYSPVAFLLAEIEFATIDDAHTFAIPEFFGPEVTEIATMRSFPALIETIKKWQVQVPG